MPLSQPSHSPTQADPTSTAKVAEGCGTATHPAYLQALAREVQHNLLHQHNWTSLRIHTSSPLSHEPLPRPLVSGLPPHRIYVHPDEQIEELKQGLKEEDVGVEREWVLPTRLKEKWSLRRFGEVFDGISEEPAASTPDETQEEEEEEAAMPVQTHVNVKHGKRRGGKRLLLATVGDDSTVVYYIVHDGIVKPRQN
ncbi:MAG: hypothetical protein OHK93_006197 [Ramalina farinacea]|uniref:tRNA-splicing endonuclease subunit Sen15 domain-containing protein n=1 Tax=Ramalina farinacea TaxID=258253 RepID=A0AA43QMD8_9LECA|nr:hypothetical protein [Ramalina farinacea]